MSQEQGIRQQLAAAQTQIQQLSRQLALERDAARHTQIHLQEQLEQQQQHIAHLEAQTNPLPWITDVEPELQRIAEENRQFCQTLKTQETTYRYLFDCNPQPMLVYDLETLRFLAVNDALVVKYGYSRAEFLAMTIADIRPPEDIPRLLENVGQVDSGLDVAGVWRHRLQDGRIIQVEIVSYALEFEGRRAELVMVQDHTERLQAEQALRDLNHSLEQTIAERTAELHKSKAELQAILNNSPAKIYVEDLEGRYIFVNQAFLRLFKCQPEKILGKTSHEFFPPDVADAFRVNDQRLLEQGGIQQFEEIVRVNGEDRVYLSNKFLLRNDQGEAYAICGISTDITDLKQIETRLKRQLAAIEAAVDGIAILQDNTFLYLNRAHLEIFGYTQAEELIGQPWTTFYSQQEVAHFEREIIPALQRDGAWVGEVTATRKDGTTFDQGLSLTLTEDGLMICVCEDISDRKQASQASQASRQLLQTVVTTTPIGVFWKDRNLVYQGINPAAAKILGLTDATALVGCTDADLPWQPETLAIIQAEDRQIMEMAESRLEVLQSAILRDGSQIWLETNKVPLQNAAGNVIGVLGTAQDVTQRKQTELELQDLTTRLTLALQAGAYGTWDWDMVHEAVWDRRMYEIYGLQNLGRAATYQDWRDRVHPDDIAPVEAELERAVRGEVPFNVEFRIWRMDGKLCWVQAIARVQQDSQGRPIRMVGLNQDITERKETEEQLHNLFGRLSLALKAGQLGVWSWDLNQQLFWDAQLCRIYGIPETRQFTSWQDWRSLIHSEDIERVEALLQAALDGASYTGVEFRIWRTDGGLRWVQSFAEVQRDYQGNPIRMVGINCDITDRKQAELDLQHTNQELARATRLKDEFLANMSHELRTPLNAILGMAEGLQEEVFGPLTDRQRRSLGIIERSGNHLLSLINDILDVAKIEAGQLELDFTAISVSLLCNSSLTFVKQQAQKQHLQLETQIPSHLPDLYGDERRLRQVLINLLTNAVKFTPEGGRITLSATYTPLTPEAVAHPHDFIHPQGGPSATRGMLTLTVADTGIGISPDNAKKLFHSFIQIDSALNRQHEGTGLGLALVKRITEMHGGKVALTSEAGNGSCFTIQLPIIAIASGNAPTATPTAAIQPPSRLAPTTAPLILLAEDNEANIRTITAYLTAKGYYLVVANNGIEAINLANSANPDLILMDIQMPQLDGLAAIRQIRQNPTLANVPIVALTALAMEDDQERCLAAGADEYISKPVRLRQLFQVIQTLLAKPSTE